MVVYKITVRETVEERILALQQSKRLLAEQALEGGAKSTLKVGLQELMALFRHDYSGGGGQNQNRGQSQSQSQGQGHWNDEEDARRSKEEEWRPNVEVLGRKKKQESAIYGRRW